MAYGTVNADVIGTSVAGSNLGAGNASIMKNRLINSDMRIDQRNAGASVTPTATGVNNYTLDRWTYVPSQASKASIQQNAGSVTPPVGFSNYLGITSLSAYSITSTDYFNIRQNIEGFNVADLNWGTANAKTITISAWVRSSLTGTFGGCLNNSDYSRSYAFTYSIPVANTWTQISVTIAGDTSGTWLTTNGNGVAVTFGLGNGSTVSTTAGVWTAGLYLAPTGATSVVGTSGATFYITGVQLEVGSSATGFEYRQYQQELALCQRYYHRASGGSPSNYCGVASGVASNTSIGECVAKLPVSMRTIPTVNYGGTITFYDGVTGVNVSSIRATYGGNDAVYFTGNTASGLTVGRGVMLYTGNASTNYVDFSAEL